MRKIIAAFLSWMLVLPVFAAAKDDATPPPVPSSGNVTLALDEYNRLVELAAKPVKRPDAPPVSYSMKRADLKFTVQNDSVQGTVQLQGEILRKGATKVPLTTGLAILDGRQEGKGIPLELENGTHTAVLSGPGEFALTLDAGLPLSTEAGRAYFNLPVPASGSARLNLVVPGDHANVRVSPGLITARTSEKGQTTIEATLVPGQTANIWWTTREVATPVATKEARFLSDVKTLVTVSEADLRIATLADITLVQGEPAQFQMGVPAGFEVTGVTGSSVESSEIEDRVLTVKVNNQSLRNHQFLITLEKAISEPKADAPFLSFKGTQRETGEVLVEGAGTIELTAREAGGLKRMDFKEVNSYLRSLARFPMQAAFRYHKQPNQMPALALEWTRFPDSSVLAAVAEHAAVTTLVTSEGRSLTEVKLTIKNQAQPFLKVALPAGATILSAEVAGEKVKPVEGPDGNRVPLLRPGLRPTSAYEVSFVFLHSGAPFSKKGGSDLSLPKMDVPINLLHWEVFLPEQYKVKDFGGDAIAANLLPAYELNGESAGIAAVTGYSFAGGVAGGPISSHRIAITEGLSLLPGQLGGILVDPSGAAIANAKVRVTQSSTGAVRDVLADETGRWMVSNLNSGLVEISARASGFSAHNQQLSYDATRPVAVAQTMQLGAVAQSVEVNSSAITIGDYTRIEKEARKSAEQKQTTASANVTNLQQRISGVLPVRIDVPKAGNSYNFVRPLVLDEETKVTFTYKSK